MPEAALARELGVAYACCAVVVNRAAGKGDLVDADAVTASVDAGMLNARSVLESAIAKL